MMTAPSLTQIYPPNPFIPLTKVSFHSYSNLLKSSSCLNCSNPSTGNKQFSEQTENGGALKSVLSGMVDKRVQELLNKEENRVLLDGLDKAAERVELARRELAQIELQEIEAQFEARKNQEYINQLESRAAEIDECLKEISEAKALVLEAERSLEGDGGGMMTETEREAMYKNKERFESVKAAFISAIVGTLAGLPISLAQVSDTSQLVLPVAINLVSCALYGVTFRYAVRKDFNNFQLKNGTSAAFGVVKGLATLGGGSPLELGVDSILSHAIDGAVYVSENLLIFLFAAVGLDFCIKLQILSPFPIERSDSRTTTD